MIHDLLQDLNAMKFFNSEAVQTVVEKYGYEVVDFFHEWNFFVLLVADEKNVAKLVYVKPKRKWYVSDLSEMKEVA